MIKRTILLLCGLLLQLPLLASSAGEEFDISETLFHHVLESHNWHIVDIPAGDDQYISVSIPLPWILYHSERGLEVFFLTGHEPDEINRKALDRGYLWLHEKLHPVDPTVEVLGPDGQPRSEFTDDLEQNEAGEYVPTSTTHAVIEGPQDRLYAVDESVTLLDFSISKTPLQMIIVGLVMLWVFTSVAQSYRHRAGQAPKGAQSLFEPIILFVRDDIARTYLHDKYLKFTPYLLTLFFFIWFANLFGLTPLNSNISGNISVTAALAVLSFLITNANGTKDYWQHIFWFPGVPLGVKLIMLPVEIVGMFTKPFSLTIRLFANIAGGHFMVLSLICLIFLMSNGGENVAGALGILPLSIFFTLFILTLEMLVAVLQAYVFTLLTAVFIGQALESHDDHH